MTEGGLWEMNEFDWTRSRMMSHLPALPDWTTKSAEYNTPRLKLWIRGRLNKTHFSHKYNSR